ncbi:MAG TPA: hypothetical protein VFQ53_26410 [Kofleriaceae bacterium]|nr:hypothetical protein [Kofleriaceae bacterium]
MHETDFAEAVGLRRVPIDELALDHVACPLRRRHPVLETSDAWSRVVRGFEWSDPDDDRAWSAQGLSSSGDGLADGAVEGRRWLIASWQHRVYAMTRVSFVDISEGEVRYTHALLAEPVASVRGPTFRDVGNHALGIAWYRDRLFAIDTWGGVRVFALDQIVEATGRDPELVGRQPDGTYHARGCRYIVPQIARYVPVPGFLYRWSFCGIDRSSAPHALVTGALDAATSELHWWPLDGDGMLAAPERDRVIVPTRSQPVDDPGLQAVHAVRDRERAMLWLLARKHGRSALLVRGVDDPRDYAWPHHARALAHVPQTGELWTSVEHDETRFAFSVRRRTL